MLQQESSHLNRVLLIGSDEAKLHNVTDVCVIFKTTAVMSLGLCHLHSHPLYVLCRVDLGGSAGETEDVSYGRIINKSSSERRETVKGKRYRCSCLSPSWFRVRAAATQISELQTMDRTHVFFFCDCKCCGIRL